MDTRYSAPSRAPRHQQPRSRDENQERAYIAASRRTDRSLEARVQSAQKASDLHQKRTGKALRITEQIVFNDETYEEEDSWIPASRSLLGPQLQTLSADFNSRVEAFLEQKLVMSSLVAGTHRQQQTQQTQRWGEIDRLFAESFPNAAQTARRLAEDIVPPTPSVMLKEEQGSMGGTPGKSATEVAAVQDVPVETSLPVDWTTETATEADDLPDQSVFTADLPPEVLMFLGQSQGQSLGNELFAYDDCIKTGQDVSFSAFGDVPSFAPGLDNFEVPSGVMQSDESLWNDELDAYIDSSAWLDFSA
ncbi:hypothetical protein E4U13_001002 [Claviceps humidiphila]|uniref:Uncharacterized protein n=1 Tax=Claviceps humidiphila TaxID=1294629 RepID=A0A9P7Q2X6_9HYPO|nr:hypothetical protein E4U13_001002 [Claviceps humidiphila]